MKRAKTSSSSSSKQTWLLALVIGALAASGAVGTSRVCRSRCSPLVEPPARSPGDAPAPRTWTVSAIPPFKTAGPSEATAVAERASSAERPANAELGR